MNVAFANNPKLPHDANREISQHVVLGIRQRLAWCNDDTLAGVNSHRIEVLHVANRDAIIDTVTDDFVFNFLPPTEVLLDEDLRRVRQSAACTLVYFGMARAQSRAQAAQRICRTKHDGVSDCARDFDSLFSGNGGCTPRNIHADTVEALYEQIAILGITNGLNGSSEHRDTELLQHAFLVEFEPAVERRLTAEGDQNSIRSFFLDNLRHEMSIHRQKIDFIREMIRRLDGCDIRIHQDRGESLLLQCLDRLTAGVVEFTGLADFQRTATEYQDFARMLLHVL